ncbi:MAG: hypothetical protein KF893_03775 [Caldilineaceae bacterium]|nr:hypothetical protein [Caldilineaceae bacterium]
MDLELPEDFKEFLRLLNSYQVEYLLIGGYAVGYHGYPRATNDMDVWVAIHPNNAERLVQVMQAFGFSVPELSVDLFLQEQKIIRMGNPPMRIEILTSISGVTFRECYEERIVDVVDGVSVNLIALKHLKENKRASGRYKDLNDLEHLM